MHKFLTCLCALVLLAACKNETDRPEEFTWEFEKAIALDDVNPIGIAINGEDIYLSDGDNNRVVQINQDGKIIATFNDFERPMHIDYGGASLEITGSNGKSNLQEPALFVPEYGRDSIAVLRSGMRDYVVLQDSLDAPAAVSVYKNEIAIADFYNHRILYYDGNDWIRFGKEGNEHGMFYYPTDVQITSDAIFVADAYNNRGQVFDKKGNFIKAFGEDLKINAATGIFVSTTEIYLTDFENKRILVFNKDYSLKQELKTSILKPTDVLIYKDKLLITDYGSGALIQYKQVVVKK